MKIKALITTLILSTSSVALAKPIVDLHLDASSQLTIRDHRGPMRPTWAPLSTTIKAGGKKQIKIEERRDNLTALRLQAGIGATYIYSLQLRYDDGTRETLKVNKWLYSREPIMTFDLAQHRGGLARITVSSFSWDPATFQIMGQRMRNVIEPYPQPQPLPPPPPPVGLMVGKDLSFANSDGYVHVPVGSDKGRFTRMQIESVGPSTYIGHIHVTYATGAHQEINVNRAFVRGEKLDLQLDGKGAQAVTAITVMAHQHDVRAVGPSASRFNVTLF